MAELNYMPNAAARSLASKKTRTLGAIIPTLNNAIFAEGMNAFESAARELGYTLLLSVSNYDLSEEENLVRNMVERNVDGLVLIGNDHLSSVFNMLEQADLRFACIWAYEENTRSANIGFSNTNAMKAVVDHLVDQGHKRVAMLAGQTNNNDRARTRLMSGREQLLQHDLSLPKEQIIEVPYSIRAARGQLKNILKTKPTAIICGNDVIAIGAVLEAQKLGLSFPDDIAITGFDNLPLSQELSPGITTVDVYAAEMGVYSAKALIKAIENGSEIESQCLKTDLIIRGTTVA